MENMVKNIYLNQFKDKKVFITGHTGFKGMWMTVTLLTFGAKIKGFSQIPQSNPSIYNSIINEIEIESEIGDINNYEKIEKSIIDFEPDFIFHLAAQPLVRKSYQDPLETFLTNVSGTANVLNAIRKLNKKCSVILITTDKVYENKEWMYPYRENDRLGGYDPYSASKACSEIVIDSFRNSYFNINNYFKHEIAISSVRAGNVIGGGDWSEDRLIPDIVRSIISESEIIIRNPDSIRPWQHVIEPIYGYLKLAIEMDNYPLKFSGSWNFGPNLKDNITVSEIALIAIEKWGKGKINVSKDQNSVHEAKLLKLDISKVGAELKWKPIYSSVDAIEKTIKWYINYYKNPLDTLKLIEADIDSYIKLI
jgi:CDP-glucose 4,6-dehydratase